MYIIDNSSIAQLKTQLEAQGIVTEKVGLTEVRLRKILLANSVTMSFSDTLSAAPLVPMDVDINSCTETQSIQTIVDTLKLKDPTASITTSNFTSYLDKKESKNVWPVDDPNYDLYYEKDTSNDTFFYFKDTDGLLGPNTNIWYIGSMGATTIQTKDGTPLVYYDSASFNTLKQEYDNLRPDKKVGSAEAAALEIAYTKTSADKITVYNVDVKQRAYEYTFKNQHIKSANDADTSGGIIDGQIKLNCIDDTSTYNVTTQEISLANEIDMSTYAIPIELMIDLLTVTGSGEFLEEFIDYSLSKVAVKVETYTLATEDVTYDKLTYDIKGDFVLELYDIIDFGSGNKADSGDDNFKAYKNIVYDRKYNGSTFHRITDLSDLGSINYNGNTYGNGSKYSVPALGGLLKTAYNPPSGFNLGPINVTEIIATTNISNKWQVVTDSVSTWYGNFSYTAPTIQTIYHTSEFTREATPQEYLDYNQDKLILDTTYTSSDIKMKDVYLSKTLADQGGVVDSHTEGNPDILIDVVPSTQEDIYNDALATQPGGGNSSQYRHWNVRGLSNIAVSDNNGYGDTLGAGKGCDYIYAEYTKTNFKKYEPGNKSYVKNLDTSNVKVVTSSTDMQSQLNEFLKLLKNETGEIPSKAAGSVGQFKKDGIVVKYGDIYSGKILAGDLLLDNGAEVMFDLLASSENTQGLVPVFKYLAYLYTGISYGITDVSQIGFLFSANAYRGADFVVDTRLAPQEQALTKEQLTEAIEKTYSGQTKTNLLSCVDDFMYIQQANNVNAVFGVAVAVKESTGGYLWDYIDRSTYNWMSVKGSYNGNSYTDRNGTVWKKYPSFNEATRDFGNLIAGSNYFQAGNYSVTTIAPIYCDESWGNDVVAEMTKIYANIGIVVNAGGIEGEQNGITTFTVNEKTYMNYKQINPAYKNITLANYPNSNVYDSGCAVTSVAIIASAYNVNITPIEVNNYEAQIGSTNHPAVVQHYTGLNCSWVYTTDVKAPVVSQLRAGHPTIIHLSRGHFLVILSISEDGNSIYVSDPGNNNPNRNGWQPVSYLENNGIDRYMQVTP